MDVSCHRPFLPGTSLETAVILTAQASSFTHYYYYYYYYYYMFRSADHHQAIFTKLRTRCKVVQIIFL